MFTIVYKGNLLVGREGNMDIVSRHWHADHHKEHNTTSLKLQPTLKQNSCNYSNTTVITGWLSSNKKEQVTTFDTRRHLTFKLEFFLRSSFALTFDKNKQEHKLNVHFWFSGWFKFEGVSCASSVVLCISESKTEYLVKADVGNESHLLQKH